MKESQPLVLTKNKIGYGGTSKLIALFGTASLSAI